jgi:hypothetical protein
MKTKHIVLFACAIVIAAGAATAQQAPRVTSSVSSGIGVVMPAQAIPPGSRGNEGGTATIYPDPDMPVSSDGVVGAYPVPSGTVASSPPSYGSAGMPQGIPMDVPPCADNGSAGIAPGGCIVPEPGVAGGSYPGDPQSVPGYDPAGQEHPPVQVEPPVCGHQDLVGKKITDVDLKSFKTPVRVVFPGSPVTMDYSADRINLIVEEGTDFILQVTCG